MTDRERTINKLALLAARIVIKESLKAVGIQLSFVASVDIDAAAKEIIAHDAEHNYTTKATEFYDEFSAIGAKSTIEVAQS